VPAAGLRDVLPGVLTIAVKQAIDVTGDQTDFHCWNPFNVRKFARPSSTTLRCLVEESTGRIPQWNRSDLAFPQVSADGLLQSSLALHRDFEGYLLADTPVRPFGPGIMYELVLYLAVHLGVSEIITIGWDIANSGGQNTHFYDREAGESFFQTARPTVAPPPSLGDRLPRSLRYPARLAKTRIAHARGQIYNRARPLPGETDLVADSTAAAARWLAESGVSVAAVTTSTHLDAGIRRLSVDDLFDLLAHPV